MTNLTLSTPTLHNTHNLLNLSALSKDKVNPDHLKLHLLHPHLVLSPHNAGSPTSLLLRNQNIIFDFPLSLTGQDQPT